MARTKSPRQQSASTVPLARTCRPLVRTCSPLARTCSPLGQRIAKIVKPKTGMVISQEKNWDVTYYARDAQGMAERCEQQHA